MSMVMWDLYCDLLLPWLSPLPLSRWRFGRGDREDEIFFQLHGIYYGPDKDEEDEAAIRVFLHNVNGALGNLGMHFWGTK